MNLKKIVALSALSIIVCTSCKNSLNVLAPYKDVTVVYALIDQNADTNYIRINKGFEGNGNAVTMAKQYDSIYYPVSNINAVLEDSNPANGKVVNIKLDTTTTKPLGAGVFSYPKQLLYYTTAILNTSDYYNILIVNNKTGKVVRGSTSLLQDAEITTPGNFEANKIFYLSDQSNTPTQFGWNSSPNGRIYQLTLLFYYDNQTASGPRVLQPPLQLVFAEQTATTIAGGEAMVYNLTHQQLFSLIATSLQPEQNVTRYADSLGVIFTTGSDDMNTYIQLSQPRTGINQDVPSYSDVENGIGLYTARHVQTFYKQIDKVTLDSIQGPDLEARFLNLGFLQ